MNSMPVVLGREVDHEARVGFDATVDDVHGAHGDLTLGHGCSVGLVDLRPGALDLEGEALSHRAAGVDRVDDRVGGRDEKIAVRVPDGHRSSSGGAGRGRHLVVGLSERFTSTVEQGAN